MPSFNQVTLLGNLTRDPTLKYLPSQTAVVEFGIAMNRKFNGSDGEKKEEVCFVDVSAFGKTAEVINEHFTKGKPILLTGRLKFDQWEDKNGGGKRSRLTVVAEHFTFVGSRDDGEHSGDRQDERPARQPSPYKGTDSINQGNRQRRNGPPPANPIGQEQEFDSDSIPF